MEQLLKKVFLSGVIILFVFGSFIPGSRAQTPDGGPGSPGSLFPPQGSGSGASEPVESEDISGYGYEPGTGSVEGTGHSQAETNQGRSVNGERVEPNYGESQTPDLVSSAGDVTACVAGGVVSGLITGLFTQTNPDTSTHLNTKSTSDDRQVGGSMGWPPSADSVAYCLINAMIDYIANATIEWINTGMNGNPAFVDDPKQFFSDIADIETAGFLRDIVYNTSGMDICEPFKLEIETGLSSSGNLSGSQYQCTLDDIISSAEDFDLYTSGQHELSGDLDAFWNMSQNPENNRYGLSLLLEQENARRVALEQNTAMIDMTLGSGFLSFKKCSEDGQYTDEAGTVHNYKGACAISTPGKVIEEQLNSKLKLGDNRLVMADKFDQVISTLINQMIKTALNQVLNNN